MVGALSGARVLRRLEPKASAAECEAMLDRYTEQLARAASPSPAPSAIASQKTEARALARESPAFEECPRRVSAEQAHCALSSDGADAFERCLLR